MGKASKRKAERRALEATNTLEQLPSYTEVPGMLTETGLSDWISADATSAEPSEEDRSYAQTLPSLIDKHFLHEGLHVPFGISAAIIVVGWVVLLAWMLIQDNSAGRLEAPDGISKFTEKAKVATIIVALGGGFLLALGAAAKLIRGVAARVRRR